MRICCFAALLALTCIGLFGCAASAVAQRLPPKVPHVSGRVLDSLSRAPVPNVLVRVDGREAKTDEKGRFFISSSPNYPFHAGAAATVHTVYYDGKTRIKSRKSVDSLTVLLHRNRYRFRADKCLLNADSTNIRPYASPVLFDLWPSNPIGVLIQNTSPHAFDTVRTISIRGGNPAVGRDDWAYRDSGWDHPFRLWIFQIDSTRSAPGRELLTDGVVLCFPQPDSTYTFDLRHYEIVVSSKDIVVVLQPVVQGDRFYLCPEKLVKYKPRGLVLRAPCAFADSRTWSYDSQQVGEERVGSWRRLTESENCWPLYERIFSVELSGRK